ncbi:ATP-binding cassette domain-containing protein [Streptomyces sp. TRM68367]|nr:ATP-binding cassette domain-containing protein [Streptomyces sp. TRM68367]
MQKGSWRVVEPAVATKGLVQRYGRKVVLNNLDLVVRSKGITGIVGPNGAGKTTLLSTVATLMQPAGGEMSIIGLNPTRRQERKEIRQRSSFLPQSFGYIPKFTVKEFVGYAGWLKGIPSARIDQAVSDAIEYVSLTEKADQPMGRLSGGMIRRVGIASALVNSPEILILDEPTVGLDPRQRLDFRTVIKGLGETSTVLLSTHLIEDIAATCKDVLVIQDGAVMFSGDTKELAQAGDMIGEGQSPLERGYAALIGEGEPS